MSRAVKVDTESDVARIIVKALQPVHDRLFFEQAAAVMTALSDAGYDIVKRQLGPEKDT